MVLSAAGLGSGLDVNSLVTQLMAVERRPLELLTRAGSGLQTTLSAFGRLSSALSTFQDAAAGLATANKWQVFKATTNGNINSANSTDSAISGSASSNASEGSYAIQVNQLAKAQTVVSGTFASTSSTLGAGTILIQLGTYDGTSNSFIANTSKPLTSITINPGSDSISQIRDAINSANAGVTASIANTGSGARLLLTAKESGAANSIQLTVQDADGINTDNTGLSQLAFDPTAATGSGRNLVQTQAAQNASLNINGIDVVSTTNVVQNAIDGLTLNLRQATTTPVTLNVTKDTDAIRKSVDTFISAYNDLNKTMVDLTKYEASSRQAGALQGDRTAVGVMNQIRSLMRSTFSGVSNSGGDFTRLSDVGVELQREGTLQLNTSKWNEATASLDRVARLFSSIGTVGQPDTQGFAKRLETLARSLLGGEGVVTQRSEGIRTSITKNQRQQESMQGRLELTEKRLRAQYQSLDTRISAIQAQSSYLQQQLSALNNQNRNS
jgi:flagellar hook-associated protein 2